MIEKDRRMVRNVSSAPLERKWDEEADVVIAGYGSAGASAAIAAHDAGAKVIIVESMPKGGGNTVVSMGGFLCPTDPKSALTYISALYDVCHSYKDEEVIRVFAEESAKNVEWIKSLKENTEVQVYGHAGYPEVPGAESMKRYCIKGKGKGMTVFAKNLWNLLSYAVEDKRKIPVLTKTPARRLLNNGDAEIIGIVAECEGEDVAIRANRAVILTTGGYEYDKSTLQNSIRGYPIYAFGSPGNTGDGIRMAQKVGAGLWHMNGVSCGLGIKVPDFETAFPVMIDKPGHILVDRGGRRFVNEVGIEAHSWLLAVDYLDVKLGEFPRIPCYAIFDETARSSGPISRLSGLGAAGQKYKWSKDNNVEIEKGWIFEGRTIDELGKKLKIDGQVLGDTVAKWNDDVSKGADTNFHRPITAQREKNPAYSDYTPYVLSKPIEDPPFYGLELFPCLINTQGGPRRNSDAQVLDSFGHRIPRLYSAGELGSMWGIVYQGAGNIAECLVFGRIAGNKAAGEKPWVA